MTTDKNEEPQNYVELTNDMVLEIAQKELDELKSSFEKIQNNSTKTKKNTEKLKDIHKLIQQSELDQVDKEQFINALDNLKKSIENINNENSDTEFDKVIEVLDSLIQKELDNLKNDVQNYRASNHKNWNQWPPIRPKEVEEGIENSSENIPRLIEDAKNDKSWFIRNVIAKLLERANS